MNAVDPDAPDIHSNPPDCWLAQRRPAALGRQEVRSATDGGIGSNEFKEELEVVVFDVGVDEFHALAIHDADDHLPGVEVDSAIVFGGGGVIFHAVIRWGVRRNAG
jgi:hypothetical protein